MTKGLQSSDGFMKEITVEFPYLEAAWKNPSQRMMKVVEFSEVDGDREGKLVFQLDKASKNETFRLSTENPWVTVDSQGNVSVKKKWDYEEMGNEKAIDFRVKVTNDGGGERVQRVKIQVADANDEPPYFINRPLPMQATIPSLESEPGLRVYTLLAKDPDGNHDLRYVLLEDRGKWFHFTIECSEIRNNFLF